MKIKKSHITVIGIIAIIGAILYFLSVDKAKENKKYQDEAKKFESILDITSNPGGGATKPLEDPNSIGGDMTLVNRLEVIDSFKNENDGILVVNSLIDSFKFLHILKEDNQKFDTKSYFEKNKTVINKLYGIEEYEIFSDFASKINSIENLREYKILSATIDEVGNITTFDLVFISDNPVTIKMKVYISDRNNSVVNIYVLED